MGRPAGRRNKPKIALLRLLQQDFPDYHPVVEMARLANDPEASRELRFNANKEVSKYVMPQLKAIEHTGADGDALRMIISADPLTLEQWEAQQVQDT